MKEIADIFTQLGYHKDEATIRLTLYQLGTKPASTIADKLSKERTGVYKTLRQLTHDGLVQQTKKRGVTQFRIQDTAPLFTALERQSQSIHNLQSQQDSIQQQLLAYDSQRHPHIPKISLYDGHNGVRSLFENIYQTTITNGYLVIKFFATNTFEAQSTSTLTGAHYYHDIFAKLRHKRITIETYLGNGILIMEQINKTIAIDQLGDLPAGQASVNLLIVGTALYIIIFKDTPIGIKIDSPELANTMHFLFEKLQTD